jgi:hypothetical protein
VLANGTVSSIGSNKDVSLVHCFVMADYFHTTIGELSDRAHTLVHQHLFFWNATANDFV